MFRIRQNIIFSVMAHSLLLAAALFIGGGSELRKSGLFTVSLLDELNSVSVGSKIKLSEDIKPHSTRQPVHTKSVIEPKHDQTLMPEVSASAGIAPASRGDTTSGEISIDLSPSPSASGSASASAGSSQRINIRQDIGNISASQEQGSSSEAAGSSSLKNRIRDTLQRNLVYPYIARKRRMEGTVLVDFRINQKGMAENVRVLKGSGYAVLDSAALETVVKASPFPGANYSIEVPITYRLTKRTE